MADRSSAPAGSTLEPPFLTALGSSSPGSNTIFQLHAACAFGLEAIVKRELAELGYEAHVAQPGRLAFAGDSLAICRTNLWLRTADRIAIVLAEFDCPDFDALFDTVRDLDWATWVTADGAFPVKGRSRRSQLSSVPAIQRSVKKAAVEGWSRAFGTSELPESGPVYGLEISLLDDRATLTLDTTGPSLHKRGYRTQSGPAPLKETLAAALILLSVWSPERPLWDPFCGSGTIPIEAALIGRQMAPGLNRGFPSQQWPMVARDAWRTAAEEALAAHQPDRELQLMGTDIDSQVLDLARVHARQAGVDDTIHFQQKPFNEIRSKREYGCVITNPPYGERLESERQLETLYQSFPAVLQRFPTWSHFILTSMPLERIVGQRATRRRKLFNGRIECQYFQFLGPKPPSLTASVETSPDVEETEGAAEDPTPSEATLPADADRPRRRSNSAPQPVFGGLTPKDQEQAELFEVRLRKRARHLRRWPGRGIACYRLYDRDIPELPFVVDRYGDYVHMTEYERPHDRDLGHHGSWLERMKQAAATALDVPIQRIHFKTRLRQRGAQQYERVDANRELVQVPEGGLTFLVNLTDYVDTGLFLDHRQTRDQVRNEASGKRFLNLFGYTGSFTVYAAAGGAVATTTVDLSRNYLDWAHRNLKTNGLDGPEHRFVHSDARRFLAEATRRGETYDLVVVDPPTFSNSKQTDADWEVQRDHGALLKALHAVLAPQAVVYFSTNFRRFRLDEATLTPLYRIVEISRQTVPEDFRNRRIHRCWKLFPLTPTGGPPGDADQA